MLEKLLRTKQALVIQPLVISHLGSMAISLLRSTIHAILEVAEAVKRAEDHNHVSRRLALLVTLD